MRFWFLYGLYVLACIILTLIVCEGVIRLFHLGPPAPKQYGAYIPDRYLPFRPRPLSVLSGRSSSGEFVVEYKHNTQGFRDVEHTLAKPEGTFRILGLGDSFTLGAGVGFEDTYLYRLEKLLNERPGEHPPVEIIKAGISNYFAEAERLLFQHYGVKYHPDLVTVAFVPNDIVDTHLGINGYRVSKLGFLQTREACQLGEFGTWLYFHCHLSRGFLRKYAARRIQKEHPFKMGEIYKPNGYHEKDWVKLESEYAKMTKLAQGIDAAIVFVHIPERNPWNEMATYPAKRLAKWCEEHDVTFIDMFPALMEASRKESVYWKRDPHCNKAGYRVIAETIFARLLEEKLVP